MVKNEPISAGTAVRPAGHAVKTAKFLLAAAMAAAILLRPQQAVDSARQAMLLWSGCVAPALFPFLALMPLLTGPEACVTYDRMFAWLMKPVFRLPGSAAPAVIIGLISGSPGGAISLARIASQTGMKKSSLRRLAPVICGLSPAYLIMGVGLALFGSVETGLKLAGIQLGVQLFLLFILRFFRSVDDAAVPDITFDAKPGFIRPAVEAVLGVCGYMVFFSVAASAAAVLTGEKIGRFLLLALNLPSGMAELADPGVPGRMTLAAIAVGFGGICISAQNMHVLAPLGMSWRDFLTLKFVESALCGAVSYFVFQQPSLPSAGIEGPIRISYAFSLLITLFLCGPILISLSKKLFLNNPNNGNHFSI